MEATSFKYKENCRIAVHFCSIFFLVSVLYITLDCENVSTNNGSLRPTDKRTCQHLLLSHKGHSKAMKYAVLYFLSITNIECHYRINNFTHKTRTSNSVQPIIWVCYIEHKSAVSGSLRTI